ncbi:MAG TPA: YraN family protein [Anaerolineales bacterium]|nr:YraN family protein [Anaerolineales bacterium]
MTSREVARWGEAEADRYLRRLGWEIVEANWSCRYGEIDRVARDREGWVFIEVKARRSRSFGLPEEAVTPAKRRRLLRAAVTYLQEHNASDDPWRIDVIAIEGRPRRPPTRLDHYRDAIEADEGAFP